MNKKTIDDINLSDKKVIIRADFNVPIVDGKVTSNLRIEAAAPTIKKASESGAKVILMSHLGRIKDNNDKKDKSLEIIGPNLANALGKPVKFVSATHGKELENEINKMKKGDILLMENTRFEDVDDENNLVKKESKNDPELGRYWASLGDIFINDAFGTAHRAHASNVGIATNIGESCVGYLVNNEIEMLNRGLETPEKPFVAIVGGAKVSDKLTLIGKLADKADKVIIGGGMAYTFMKAQGFTIGKSLVENEQISQVQGYMNKYGDKLVLPVDFQVSSEFADMPGTVTIDRNIPEDKMGLDIGPQTREKFTTALQDAKTVLWNGPMGVAEFQNFKSGTEAIAKAIVSQPGVFSVIGGGDSASIAIQLGFANQFSHISTGGGASLTLLEGKPLPGVEAIQNKATSYE